MLTNLIENRGKEFSNLIKIGDYLARTLRENVELFNVEDGRATYLTESGSVISGKYSFKPTLKLTKIVVEDASILEDKKCFEEATNQKVSNLLFNLMDSDYTKTEKTFDNILSMYETKLSYERINKRLQEKVERFGEQTKIVSSKEFNRVKEIRNQIVEFLTESKVVDKSPTLKNGVKLSALVSASFDLPKMTVNEISEAKSFEVKNIGKTSLYEHLCRRELIQKELLEAKHSFDNIWVDNNSVQDLASMIFESDEENVRHQVAQVVTQVPYFALASKKQINSIIRNSLSMNEVTVKNKELNSFTSKIFEMKKPVKSYVIKILNEKYGIDIRKLDEVPTFGTLLMTEAEILKIIARESPADSIVRKTLIEFVNCLNTKNGAEAIDLADFINEVFDAAGCTQSLNESQLMDYMDFSKVADDLGKIGQVLKMLVPAVETAVDQVEDHEAEMSGEKPEPDMPPDDMDSGSEVPMDTDTPDADDVAQEVQDEVDAEEAEAAGEEPEMPDEGEEEMPAEGEEEMPDEGEEEMPDEGEEAPEEMEQDDLTSLLSQIEDLLSDLKGEGEDEGEEDFEEPMGDEEDEEPEDKKKKPDPEQYKS